MKQGALRVFMSIFILLMVVYLLGSSPKAPQWDDNIPHVPQHADSLESYIRNHERMHSVKPDNEARIVWAESSKKKTTYSVVYLHGFSASQEEGDPTHLHFAKKFGCNLYLSRLSDHGIDTVEHLLNFTVDRLWESAKRALAIGNAIGQKVILMGSSTGVSIALVLATTYPNRVDALINMSPNIKINDPFAFMLNNHWGLNIARMVKGGKYIEKNTTDEEKKYWYSKYRLEAAVQLQELLEDKMNQHTFEKVDQPSITLYYYRDEKHQDPVVKVDAIRNMHRALGTPNELKVAVAVPNANAHVIGCRITSKDVETVMREVDKFAVEKLKMTPVSEAPLDLAL